MLLFIHGLGEVGDGSAGSLRPCSGWPPHANRQQVNHNTNAYFPDPVTVNGKSYEFIVVAPQLNAWVLNNDAKTALNDMMNYTINHYSVDTTRKYLTGLSMGAGISCSTPAMSRAPTTGRSAGDSGGQAPSRTGAKHDPGTPAGMGHSQ